MWYIGNDESPSLSHHGILGMKWGVRRYQNSDGSLTAAGKKRYLNPDGSMKPNKTINAKNYIANQRINNVKKGTEKKYSLSKHQKEYMDEQGNLTLKGGKLLPMGYDLGRKDYRDKAGKLINERSNLWKKYIDTGEKDVYKQFKDADKKLFKELDEIDVDDARQWILKNIK